MIWWSKPIQDYLTTFSVRTEKKKLIEKSYTTCNNNWWMTSYGWNLPDIQKITKQLVRLISAIICFSVRILHRKRKERWYVWQNSLNQSFLLKKYVLKWFSIFNSFDTSDQQSEERSQCWQRNNIWCIQMFL